MKHRYSIIVLGSLLILYMLGVAPAAAQQGPKKTPPGQEKKQGKAQGKKTGKQPGKIKSKKISPLRQVKQSQGEVWCLEHNGQVNVELADYSICECLTETHAIAFAVDDDWTEALGQVLYHALITEKQPGIVLFKEKDENPPYILLMETLISRYDLPVTVWKVEVEPKGIELVDE